MSSDPQSSNEETQRTRRRGPSSGVGSWFWFLLVGAILFLVFFGNNLHGRSTLAYSQFLEVLSRPDEVAKIEKVIYRDESRLDVTLRKDQLLDLGKDAAKLNNTRFEVRLPLQKDEKLLERLNELSKGGKMTIVQEEDPLAGIGTLILFFLPALIILGIFFLVLPRMRDPLGGGFLNNYIRSPARKYEKGKTRITFEDVAGMENAKSELREIVEFLKNPEKFARLGATVPKGVLLFGSPGTGKTLLAKAVAGEAGVPFYSINGSEFIQMFVGVGASRVRDMFKTAKENAPCILFIDEIDAVGRMRGAGVGGGSDEREQTLNQILSEMDGFAPSETVIVMAATNRPETLDPALLRAGRFDRNVLVDRPDKQGREEILKVHAKNVKLGPNVELKQVAAITPGFVGADLANLVNEAALLAARKGKSIVEQEEFNDGVERVTAGLEKKKRIMSEEEKRRVAYHEAGHALIAYSLPNTDPVHKVSIIPRGIAALGYTMQRPEGDRYLMTQPELEAQMQVLVAGTITEELVFRDISTGAQNDLERTTNIARGMVMEYGMSRMGRVNYRQGNSSPFLAGGAGDSFGREYSEQTAREIDQEVKRLIDEAIQRTRTILTERRGALEALAQRLIEVEVVDAEDLKRIMDATIGGPRVVPGTSTSAINTSNSNPPTLATKELGLG